MRRSFLFLQGPATPFFSRLADHLVACGHRVIRIHFCAGDAIYWGGHPAISFRDTLESWPKFLDGVYSHYNITDQILFGDQRPVHRPAVILARSYGVRTHVFEEGYFRPYWVTLEREGVNRLSLLPRDPHWFREVGKGLAEPDGVVAFGSPFWKRALHDVTYHLAGMANPLIFPHYRTHAIPAPIEYAGYVKRFAWLRLYRQRELERVHNLIASRRPYFILPLQLNSDAQIRVHSRFEHMGEVIEYVAKSFAHHADADSHLAIKNHPLDTGLMSYAQIVNNVARRYGLEGRIHFFEDGDLWALVKHAQGMVTVNSTAGIVALECGTPIYALCEPIYNLQGLTAQGGLDDFWNNPEPPENIMFSCFRRVVIHATQINGGFYCSQGIKLAVENAQHALTAEKSPLENLL